MRTRTRTRAVAIAAAATALLLIAAPAANAAPASWTVVREAATQGWVPYSDLVPGGGAAAFDANLGFVTVTSPLGDGALRISTPAGGDYRQFDYAIADSNDWMLASDLQVSYDSQRLAGAPHAAPGIFVAIDVDGDPATADYAAGDIFYAIYEPAYNAPGGTDYDVWNTWTFDENSLFWFIGTVPVPGGFTQTLTAALGGAIATARVFEFTINQGTGNNGWETLVDAFSYFDATGTEVGFDFEPPAPRAPAGPAAGPTLPNTGAEFPVAVMFGGLAVIVLGAAGILLGRRRTRA